MASLYAGARGTVKRDDLAGLGSNWVVQPKLDGCFATVTLDDQGRVSNLISRKGELFPESIASELRGVLAGAPGSILVGELEAWTEASNRTVETNGYRRFHVFDALRIGDQAVDQLPYRERRELLLRDRAQLELAIGADKPEREGARGAGRDSGGKFARAIPKSWRRCPIVPQLPAHQAELAWSQWVDSGAMTEGLVAVNLSSKLGARNSKRKCKPVSTLDVVCVEVGARCSTMLWPALGVRFVVGNRQGIEMVKGSLYEVAHMGFYETSNEPRFARLVRARPDL